MKIALQVCENSVKNDGLLWNIISCVRILTNDISESAEQHCVHFFLVCKLLPSVSGGPDATLFSGQLLSCVRCQNFTWASRNILRALGEKITLAVYWISCNSDETLRKVKWFSVKDLFHLRNLCCQEVKLGAFWKKMPIFYNILQKSQPPLISLYFARKIRNHRRFIETRKWNETTLYKAKTEFVHY